MREARAPDLLVIGRRRSGDDADLGVIVLRAGRPVLLVPDTVARCHFSVWSWLGRIRVNAAADA